MSFYASEFVKPSHIAFNPQQNELIKFDVNQNLNNAVKLSSTKKPTAYISPIDIVNFKDQAIQTDSISIDINSIMDIHDFLRSERLVGKVDNLKSSTLDTKTDLESAEKKIKALENAVKQQLKNNEDVKKLLIASLGEDLASHYLKLTSDVSSFNLKVDELISEKIKSVESIDKLSIEANLWKNKFIAGRLLVDELAGWKQHFATNYKESLDAIHTLLQERQSLRQNLVMLANEMSKICSHLNCPSSKSMSIDNTVHMAKYNLDLVRLISSKLSSGSIKWDESRSLDDRCSVNCSQFTKGEELALEVLKNQTSSRADNSGRITASFSSESSLCLEKLAARACRNCRGDPFVV